MGQQITLKLGTRASPLAQWQADWVAAQLESGGARIERVLISTIGDRDQSGAIASFGTVGAFTKEIQRALLDGRIDVAVHSLKDLPTEPTPEIILAAIPARGPSSDVLVTLDGCSLAELPHGARVGTGSLRRRANLWHARRDLKMEDIRGNVDTRLRKLREGRYDALVLAEAGLARLGLADGMTWRIDHETLLPAVGQGALAVEVRAEADPAPSLVRSVVAKLDHAPTRWCVLAERALLAKLCAGCLAPVGAFACISGDDRLELSASVTSISGDRRLTTNISGRPEDYLALGVTAAQDLAAQGADVLIRQAREGRP